MKKRRTRQHIIEGLGLNHIERQILLSGNVLRRFSEYDYGYDGMIETFNELGETQNRAFMIQLKSTDNIQLSTQKQGFIVDLSKQDLELWLESHYPVLLILYDAQKEVAYFTDLQTYFNENRILLQNVRKFVRIFLSPQSIFTKTTIHGLQK
jgi:imidazolonepropionase-like amidohydrolase